MAGVQVVGEDSWPKVTKSTNKGDDDVQDVTEASDQVASRRSTLVIVTLILEGMFILI